MPIGDVANGRHGKKARRTDRSEPSLHNVFSLQNRRQPSIPPDICKVHESIQNKLSVCHDYSSIETLRTELADDSVDRQRQRRSPIGQSDGHWPPDT